MEQLREDTHRWNWFVVSLLALQGVHPKLWRFESPLQVGTITPEYESGERANRKTLWSSVGIASDATRNSSIGSGLDKLVLEQDLTGVSRFYGLRYLSESAASLCLSSPAFF
ncbi:hypothetical protein BBK36DRAFT_1145481 [Trichoderma citrinoviride]|uniref:Uncharacterized protein n=1 Tax=Trichoderma citrinoviride TaxID=58853 RepID=A0A2T4AX79_9HYPO|nr:hypothetical protein BBK36DRAFT_1145481 [Trichoderma citrinoviride]PTB61685.1 hypothetical protein BBK36DRAFT_1145481 [Trichoderma citrinoviride]